MENKLKAYFEAKRALAEYFNCGSINYDVVFYEDEKWTDYGGIEDVAWDYQEPDPSDDLFVGGEFMYSNQISGCARFTSSDELYTMFIVYTDFGDKNMIIFKNTNKMDNV